MSYPKQMLLVPRCRHYDGGRHTHSIGGECSVGDDERTRRLESMLEGSLYGRFFGAAGKVVEGLDWLGEQGISRCQLSPFDDSSFDRLAPVLFR